YPRSSRRSLRIAPVRQGRDLGAAERPAPERRRDVKLTPWLDHLYALGLAGEPAVDAAIDIVLDTVDDLLFERKVERCRELLAQADVERLPVEVALAFLASTLRARQALTPERESFYRRLAEKLRRDAPADVDALLAGLS